tara:strand:+ start:393 stop:527 length:135 start_codon:yes stop_codon:yes gene_type:complete
LFFSEKIIFDLIGAPVKLPLPPENYSYDELAEGGFPQIDPIYIP